MSLPSIGIGLIGCGTVGSGVVELLQDQRELYARRLGVELQLRRVLVRPQDVKYRTERVPAEALVTDPEAFFATEDMPILVELGGGRGAISEFVRRGLAMGKHVVTANKALLAAEGPELFALAREHNASIGFEASCAGGIPLITALNFGLMANRIQAMYGILNGTCNYILTQMTVHDAQYGDALAEAQTRGFAEADPTLDVGGGDTAHKLAIMASLAFGCQVSDEAIPCTGIDTLDLADVRFGSELGYEMKLLGLAERIEDGNGVGLNLAVQPCFIHREEPLAQVSGSFNAISIFGHAVGQTMYVGRGAGKEPTASAVVSDIVNIAAGWYPTAFSRLKLWPDQQAPAKLFDPRQNQARFYLRFNALDRPGVMAAIATALGDAGVSLSGIIQHESRAGEFVPLVMTTHEAKQGALNDALDKIKQRDFIDGEPVVIRVIEMPPG